MLNSAPAFNDPARHLNRRLFTPAQRGEGGPSSPANGARKQHRHFLPHAHHGRDLPDHGRRGAVWLAGGGHDPRSDLLGHGGNGHLAPNRKTRPQPPPGPRALDVAPAGPVPARTLAVSAIIGAASARRFMGHFARCGVADRDPNVGVGRSGVAAISSGAGGQSAVDSGAGRCTDAPLGLAAFSRGNRRCNEHSRPRQFRAQPRRLAGDK